MPSEFPGQKLICRQVIRGDGNGGLLISRQDTRRHERVSLILDQFKKMRRLRLGYLGEVGGELVFLDNEKVFFIRLDQPKVLESLHEHADPRAGCADHLDRKSVV